MLPAPHSISCPRSMGSGFFGHGSRCRMGSMRHNNGERKGKAAAEMREGRGSYMGSFSGAGGGPPNIIRGRSPGGKRGERPASSAGRKNLGNDSVGCSGRNGKRMSFQLPRRPPRQSAVGRPHHLYKVHSIHSLSKCYSQCRLLSKRRQRSSCVYAVALLENSSHLLMLAYLESEDKNWLDMMNLFVHEVYFISSFWVAVTLD